MRLRVPGETGGAGRAGLDGPARPDGRARDAGDIVVGWLVKLVASMAVVGVLLFDGVSVGVAELDVADTAAAAARVASREVVAGSSDQAAYDAAWREVAGGRAAVELPVEGFSAAADGTVTVTVERTVSTLVLHHVPGSERWLTVSATDVHTPG